MRFKLDESEGDGVLIRIKFPEAAAYELTDSAGNKMPETEWDENLGGPSYLTKTAGELITGYPNCGEWRYKGVDNDMDFYLTPGCNV